MQLHELQYANIPKFLQNEILMKSTFLKKQSPYHKNGKRRSHFCQEVKFLISFPGWKQRGHGAYSQGQMVLNI